MNLTIRHLPGSFEEIIAERKTECEYNSGNRTSVSKSILSGMEEEGVDSEFCKSSPLLYLFIWNDKLVLRLYFQDKVPNPSEEHWREASLLHSLTCSMWPPKYPAYSPEES